MEHIGMGWNVLNPLAAASSGDSRIVFYFRHLSHDAEISEGIALSLFLQSRKSRTLAVEKLKKENI